MGMTKLLAIDHARLEDDVARAARGDGGALGRATGVLLPVLGRHLHRFKLPPADHQDVLQNSLSRIHSRLGDYRGDARFVTWASRVASNEALMHLRTERRRRRRITTTDVELDTVSAEEPDEPFDGTALRAALEDLPARYRDVLRARYADDKPLAIIARDLRTTESSVRCSLARGRRLLRSRLQKAGIATFAEARASLLSKS